MKADQERFIDGLSRAVTPFRPERDSWAEEIEANLLIHHGLRAGRRSVLVEAWERFSASRCAGWLNGSPDQVEQFVEWVMDKVPQ
jgi:hypothetical protein